MGQADAERRQDIVLSGAHIKEEHCIFRSERNANGDGETLYCLFTCQHFLTISCDNNRIINRVLVVILYIYV